MIRYDTYVFDCDGVILDSNRIKTEAFRLAAQPYGDAAADALVDHHVANGGISRFVKFRHFLDEIAPAHGTNGPGVDELLAAYADAVAMGLRQCAVAPGLEELRAATPGSRWLIASGGSQEELRTVFAERNLDRLFDGGIYGSPDTKEDILARELARGTISGRTLFIGDSTYDFRAAQAHSLDFVFATYWTEVSHWPDFTSENGIPTIAGLAELTP